MSGKARVSPAERFWSHVDRRSDDECWLWTASTRGRGYGAFVVCRDGVKRNIDAHRFSYMLHVGPIPDGLLVCHHCDTPRCVNPRHLFVGTYADNNRDKSIKGRNPGNRTDRGRKPFALQGSDLAVARAMVAQGHTQRAVARRFGVSPAAVCRVLKATPVQEAV
jgi:hypothetical protein